MRQQQYDDDDSTLVIATARSDDSSAEISPRCVCRYRGFLYQPQHVVIYALLILAFFCNLELKYASSVWNFYSKAQIALEIVSISHPSPISMFYIQYIPPIQKPQPEPQSPTRLPPKIKSKTTHSYSTSPTPAKPRSHARSRSDQPPPHHPTLDKRPPPPSLLKRRQRW